MGLRKPNIPPTPPASSAPEMPSTEKVPGLEKPETGGIGVHQSYKNTANQSANVMWRAKVKGRKMLADNIPLHMSLKTFDKPEEMPIEEVKQKAKELSLQRPDPNKLQYEPTIFQSPRTGQTYYMLKLHGSDPSYQKFNEHFKGRGITYPEYMGHITIDKELHDQIKREGIKPHEIEFSPLMIEHGANNPTHIIPDAQSHKDAESDITPKKLNPVPTAPNKKLAASEEMLIDMQKAAVEFLSKPYSSEAQRRWAHTAEGKEALGGSAAVHEWDEATKGKKLPEKVGKNEELEKAEDKSTDEDASPLMNRIEDKYFVHRDQIEKLTSKLREKLKEGDIDTDVRYNVNQTIYLDNDDLDCFRAAMESTKPRVKVRIRRYAPNGIKWEDVAYAELKIKTEGTLTKKNRIRIPSDIIRSVAAGDPILLNELLVNLNKDISKDELEERIRDFNGIVEKYNLKKHIVVVYQRRAYSGKDIRVTLDDMLKCAALAPVPPEIKSSLESGDYNKFVKPLNKFTHNDLLILEVKHMNNVPDWINELLKECDAKNVKFSKYCASVYSCIYPSKEIRRSVSFVDFQQPNQINKSESESLSVLQKGTLKNIGAAAAMVGALAGSPKMAHAPIQPNKQVSASGYSRDKMLNAISQVESSGGKNVNHKPLSGPINQNESAIGQWALTPATIRETIKMDPNLRKLHPKAMSLHGQDMSNYLQDNPGLERGVAERHLQRLEHHFGQDPSKIGVAWLDGISGAAKKFKAGLDPKSHWYGARILNNYNKGK